MIDQLISRIRSKRSVVCAGLDTRFDFVPPSMRPVRKGQLLEYAAKCLVTYNCALIDAIADIIPCVKVQSACYELYGTAGVQAFWETLQYARGRGLTTIADVKRNDIGSTAEAYATAYIGQTVVDGSTSPAFDADAMTVNAYLGSDGVSPFLDCCREYDRGIFILVKTSNPSSGELQDLVLRDGDTVYERMMARVAEWGNALLGANGFSEVGAVVGATYPEQAVQLRQKYPSVFLLLPGAGAQGADISQLVGCFDSLGRGAIINNSRQMLTAWKQDARAASDPPAAARSVLERMNAQLLEAFQDKGIQL